MISLDRSVALLGLRGAGKSTLGREIASSLNVNCIDMDQILVDEKGLSVPQWVEKEGWDSFRDAEAKLLRKISRRKPCVVSTGGGVITKEASITLLQKSFLSIYIHWSIPVLVDRIKGDSNRPSLKPGQDIYKEVESLYKERNPVYMSCGKTLRLKKNMKVGKTVSRLLDIIYHNSEEF